MDKNFYTPHEDVIKKLYTSHAIKINLQDAYQLKGGIISPIYCVTGALENDPMIRGQIAGSLLWDVNNHYYNVDAVAAVVSGGISWASCIANSKSIPLFRVHSIPKNHGLYNQVEGEIPENIKTMVVIDDVITSGNSVLSVVNALREKGIDVLAVYSIFDWDFPSVNKMFEDAKVKKDSLATFKMVLDYGFRHDLLPKEAEAHIRQFCNEHQ